jgi:hypothetical protein
MNREQMIEILATHRRRSTSRDEDVADAILAEMAGEWNAGVEAAALVVEEAVNADSTSELSETAAEAFNAGYPEALMADRLLAHGKVIAEAIRALRRPDAAQEARHAAYRATGVDPDPRNRNPDGSDYHLMDEIDARLDAAPAPEKRCECFGNTRLHASTHGGADGRRHCDLCGWPVADGSTDVLTAVNNPDAAPQRPATPSVSGIAAQLRKEAARGAGDDGSECCYAPKWTCCDPRCLLASADFVETQAAALAAKDAELGYARQKLACKEALAEARGAEISALRSDIHHLIADLAAELGCQADNESVLVAIAALKARAQELEAALRPFAAINESSPDDWVAARAYQGEKCLTVTAGEIRTALAPAGKER